MTSKIRRALNKLELSPLQVGVVDIGILPGLGGLRRGDTLSCLQNLISPTPHHASIPTLGGGVGLASSKRFAQFAFKWKVESGKWKVSTVIQSPQGEESQELVVRHCERSEAIQSANLALYIPDFLDCHVELSSLRNDRNNFPLSTFHFPLIPVEGSAC